VLLETSCYEQSEVMGKCTVMLIFWFLIKIRGSSQSPWSLSRLGLHYLRLVFEAGFIDFGINTCKVYN